MNWIHIFFLIKYIYIIIGLQFSCELRNKSQTFQCIVFSDYRKWDLNTPDILIGSTLQHHVCFGNKCLELLSFINWLIKILIRLDSAKVLYITMCFQVSENWLEGCTARYFSWSAQRRSTVIPFLFGKNNKINPFLNFFFFKRRVPM